MHGAAPVDPLDEKDLNHVESLDLDNPYMLSALARLCGIRLETIAPEKFRWFASHSDSPFGGSYSETKAFVMGYALCYRWERKQHDLIKMAVEKALDEVHERSTRSR